MMSPFLTFSYLAFCFSLLFFSSEIIPKKNGLSKS
jgi:hypothetical protein